MLFYNQIHMLLCHMLDLSSLLAPEILSNAFGRREISKLELTHSIPEPGRL